MECRACDVYSLVVCIDFLTEFQFLLVDSFQEFILGFLPLTFLRG